MMYNVQGSSELRPFYPLTVDCGPRIGWNSLSSLEPSQIPAPILCYPHVHPSEKHHLPKIHAQVTCTSECLRPMLIIIPSRKPYCQPATKLYNKSMIELSWTTNPARYGTTRTQNFALDPDHMACFHLVNWFSIYALQHLTTTVWRPKGPVRCKSQVHTWLRCNSWSQVDFPATWERGYMVSAYS